MTGEEDESRNHPAYPVAKPDAACITPTLRILHVFSGNAETAQSAGPFSHSPFWTTARLHRRASDGSGTLMS